MFRIFEHKLELKINDNLQVKDCELICFTKVY